MGLFTMLSGMLGCKKEENVLVKPDDGLEAPPMPGPDDEFGEVGNDYSKDGVGEYKKVVGCHFNISGMREGFSYTIKKDEKNEGRYVLECDDHSNSISEITCSVGEDTMEKLSQLVSDRNILSWDGFSKSMRGVLDGSGFSLEVVFEDGTYVSAHGSNSFPKNYNEFEREFLEIMGPVVKAEAENIREKKFDKGDYLQPLSMAMINYKDRGASGSDSYSYLIRDDSSSSFRLEINVTSMSGDFVEPGEYHYCGSPEGFSTDELLAKIQEVLVKYKVYKWDGYDESTPDYNDREWFQLNFCYPDASISAMGCGDTKNYSKVRKELLEILAECTKTFGGEP